MVGCPLRKTMGLLIFSSSAENVQKHGIGHPILTILQNLRRCKWPLSCEREQPANINSHSACNHFSNNPEDLIEIRSACSEQTVSQRPAARSSGPEPSRPPAVAVLRHGEREDAVWNSQWFQSEDRMQHPYVAWRKPPNNFLNYKKMGKRIVHNQSVGFRLQ